MTELRIATWNVNSLKVRLPHLIKWLESCEKTNRAIDVIGLQELKLTNDKFPIQELQDAGYLSLFLGQKTYNGVAILVRKASLTHLNQDLETAFLQVQKNIPGFEDDQQRLLATTLHFKKTAPLRIICGYFPNGQAPGTEKFDYKLKWLEALHQFVKMELNIHSRLVLLGDYNIAPNDEDVHDPLAWVGQNLVSEPERKFFESFLELGLIDSFRMFTQAPKTFSWWDYRMMAFRRNAGVRIDHLLISTALKDDCQSCTVDREPRKWEQPSDHAPVVMTLNQSS
jgi:exodeoxyribonuclease-3